MRKKNFHTTRFLSTVIIAFTAFFYTHAAAQLLQFNVRKISTESGLYTSDIRHLIKDSYGFIWVATSNKIQRYDGKYTKDFFIQDGNTYYRGLAEDQYGKIWVATNNNLYTYQHGHAEFVKYRDTAKIMGDYLSLLAGPGKRIYILCREGLIYLDERTGTSKPVVIKGFQMPNNSYFPFVSFKDLLFWSSRSMVYRYNITTAVLDSVVAKMTRNIEVITEDSVWAGSTSLTSSLICFRKKINQPVTASLFDKKFISADFYIAGVSRVSPRHLFVPVRFKGFFLYDMLSGRFKEVKVFDGGRRIQFDEAPKTGVYSYNNTENWLNLTDGLYYVIPENKGFGYLTISAAEKGTINEGSNSIRNYAEDTAGNLWIATGNGLARWKRSNDEVKIYLPKPGRKDYLNFASIRGVVATGNKLIVAQSQGGVFLLDPGKEIFEELAYPDGANGDSVKKWLLSDFISGIFTLKNGDFMVAGSQRIFYINKKNNLVSPVLFKGKEKIQYTRIIYEDRQRRLWFLGGPGITVTDSNFKILHRISDPKLNGIYTNSITQVADTSFWIAWEGLHEISLGIKNEMRFNPIFTDIPKQVFFNIFKDTTGYSWASGEKGIYKLYPDKKFYQLFDQSENVLNFQYSSAIPFRSNDGKVFLPGFSGVTYFNPENFTHEKDGLHTIITSVKINDTDTFFLPNKMHQLKHFQNSVDINYIAPYAYNGSKVIYRYFLEGADKGWVNAGNNTFVRFSSLPHGKYKFRAAASLNGKEWFEAMAPFIFEIKPPFWKTWWFRLLTALLVSYLAFYFFRDRINKIKQREKFKREYERKIAEVEMHALRAQMNPHFMFNSLNSINNFILKNDPDNASGYLTKFSRLMRLILDNSRSEWVLLENELKALELYIELEAVRFDNAFSYTIEISQDISVETAMAPPLIIQPYVENAIWHGLLHRKEPGGKLDIRLWKNDNRLYIEIEDNGVGRDEAKRLKSKTATKQKSHGMKITAQRMDIVNKVYNVDAGVVITDLKNEEVKQNGTRVLITLKYKTHDSRNSG